MPTDKAIDLITKLVAEGNSATYIANALNLRRIPSPRGKRWAHAAVKRICEQHQLAKPDYNPAKIAAVQAMKTPVKVDTFHAKHCEPVAELSNADSRDAAITRYAEETGLRRWLVEQAVEDFEKHLDMLAWWIERGPLETVKTGDADADKIAQKEALEAWTGMQGEDFQLRAMVAGKDDTTAVELIFMWACGETLRRIERATSAAARDAAEGTPERAELLARYKARATLYHAAEPKRSETLGELVLRAERALRARRFALAQAADDYQALCRLPPLLFDDLAVSLDKERGETGTAAKALAAAERTWRFRSAQVAEHGAETTLGALRGTKGTTKAG